MVQIGDTLPFSAFFVAAKVGKTGLTVTADVYRNGSKIVTAGSATETGDGLYAYTLSAGSVTVEGVYICIFKTADTSVDQQHLASFFPVGMGGVENLDATISSRATAASITALNNLTAAQVRTELSTELGRIDATVSSRATPAQVTTALNTYDAPTKAELDSGLAGLTDVTAAEVWTYATRTLTQAASSVTSAVSGSSITAHRGDTLTATLTGLGSMAARTKLWFTVKGDLSHLDAAATVQITEAGGLVYLNGAATTTTDGSIAVSGSDVVITLTAAATAALTVGSYAYDIQMATATGVQTLTIGTFSVTADVTRSLS